MPHQHCCSKCPTLTYIYSYVAFEQKALWALKSSTQDLASLLRRLSDGKMHVHAGAANNADAIICYLHEKLTQ